MAVVPFEFRLPTAARLPRPSAAPLHRLRRARALAKQAAARAAAVQGTHATVDAVRDRMLATDGAWRALVSVQGKDWGRLPEREQDALLDHYAWLCGALGHPVQWLVLSRDDSLAPQAALLDRVRAERGADWPPDAREVSERTAAHLRTLGTRRRLRRRDAYLVVPADPLDRGAAAAQLDARCDGLVAALGRIGLAAGRAPDAEITAALRACWYPNVPEERRALTPDDLAPAAVDAAKRDAYYVDHGDGTGHWLRGYKLTQWPEYLHGAWVAGLLASDVAFDLAIHVAPLDRDAYRDELKTRLGRHSTAVEFLVQRHAPLWDGLARAHRQVAAAAEAADGPDYRPFEVSVTAVIRAATPEDLDKLSERAEAALRGAGGRWSRTTREHHLAARTCRPEGVDALGCALEADLGTVAHLLPAITARLGHETERAVLYGFDRDQAVLLDLFDTRATTTAEINSTEIIVAPSGAGKSVRQKVELAFALLQGREAVVFDVEGEYDPLCRLFGARDVVPGRPDSASNPLELALGGDENPVRAQVQSVIGLCEVATAGKRGGLTDEQVDVLDAALIETYSGAGITPTDPDSWHRPPPDLHALVAVLAAAPGPVAAGLHKALLRYTTGSQAGLFGPRNAVAFDRPLVRFDLRRVPAAQRPLAVYLALLAVWRDQLAAPRERLVLVDEAWQYFALPHAAQQLETVALRGRKWKLAPRYVFHNDRQLAESHADNVRQSAGTQVVMRQTEQSIDGVAHLWHLSERDRLDLLTAAKGSALIYTSGGHAFADLDLTGWPLLPYVLTGLQAN